MPPPTLFLAVAVFLMRIGSVFPIQRDEVNRLISPDFYKIFPWVISFSRYLEAPQIARPYTIAYLTHTPALLSSHSVYSIFVPGRVKNFLFSTPSRPVLRPTQLPIQWVPRGLLPCG
jgi:hypothetical protein